ncbi:glycosyltransferase [Alkanindiges sp. WGS2144]|uniref:glycosyltransferase n=1 Tax=Alkanindiges sp. WGS2144 TaxID=3366808 RepID=UPI0037526607
MLPLVSIITACYNSAETIIDTIASVSRQTYPHIEHIVVNDGSSDQVEQLLTAYIEQGKIIYLQKQNGGVSSARNLGARHAQGEFFVFLDADDQLKPEYIEKCVQLLIDQPQVSLAITGVQEFDAGHAQRQLKYFNFGQFLFENVIPCAAMLRQKDFLAYGPYDEYMSFAEDWNLWISILKHQPTVAIVPELLFLYRRHQNKQSLSVIADKQKHLLQKSHNQIYANHPALYSQYIQDSPLTLFLEQQRSRQDSIKLYRKLKQQVLVASLVFLLAGIFITLQAFYNQSGGFKIGGVFLIILGLIYYLMMKQSLQRSAKKTHRV